MTNIASPWHRLIAHFIDALLISLLILFILYGVVSSPDIPGILDNILGLIIFIVFGFTSLSIIYIYLTSRFGGSPGKIITGIAVVNPQQKNISFWRAFFRNYIGYVVSGIFLFLGYVWILINSERRSWHDQIADTYVIIKRKSGLGVGLLVLVILLVANFSLAVTVVSLFSRQLPIYQQAIFPSPSPSPQPVYQY